MDRDDLLFVCDLVRKRSGIVLGEDKAYLLESRLLPVARSFSHADIHALVQAMRRQPADAVVTAVVEAMTTNESSFFRDSKPFDLFRTVVLPKIMAANDASRRIRIWSAACSTGQEPYTLAICLREEAAKLAGWDVEIVASDLAQKVIDKAGEGVYSQFEIQRGLPIQILMKYFTQAEDGCWAVKPEIRNIVTFRRQNLLEDFSGLGRFDVVFCRNVLIYFDDSTRKQVLQGIHRLLPSGGALCLGSSETTAAAGPIFKPYDGAAGVHTPS